MRDLLRRYLQARAELGEPEVLFPDLSRTEALRRCRRIAAGAPVRVRPADAAVSRSPRAGASPAEGAAAPGGVRSAGEVARLSREGTAEEIGALPDMDALRAVAEGCTRCPLHETRKNVVFGEGDPAARLVCVGEAPGANEDETGRPFVGRAGRLLDRLLLSAGFPRDSVYICNVLKSRPPRNRDPLPEEIRACSPFLLRQLDLIDPRVIVAFGTFASRTLLDTRDSLGRMRRRVHAFRGVPVVVTYHPAALLRNPRWTRPAWEDLQRARRIADGQSGTSVSAWRGLLA